MKEFRYFSKEKRSVNESSRWKLLKITPNVSNNILKLRVRVFSHLIIPQHLSSLTRVMYKQVQSRKWKKIGNNFLEKCVSCEYQWLCMTLMYIFNIQKTFIFALFFTYNNNTFRSCFTPRGNNRTSESKSREDQKERKHSEIHLRQTLRH